MTNRPKRISPSRGISSPNYEPLTVAQGRDLVEDAIGFDKFTGPMQRLIREFVESGKPSYVVSSAHPRLVDGKPSKKPAVPANQAGPAGCPRCLSCGDGHPAATPRSSKSAAFHPRECRPAGRRNNPPESNSQIRSLAVFNPIHYLELRIVYGIHL